MSEAITPGVEIIPVQFGCGQYPSNQVGSPTPRTPYNTNSPPLANLLRGGLRQAFTPSSNPVLFVDELAGQETIFPELTSVGTMSALIRVVSRTQLNLPSFLSAHRRAEKEAEALVALGPNFDGEGSPGVAPETAAAALKLISSLRRTFATRFGASFPVPSVLPAPNGKVDLRWRTRTARMLVTIPPMGLGPVSAYGADDFGNEYADRFDIGDPYDPLLRWIFDRWPMAP